PTPAPAETLPSPAPLPERPPPESQPLAPAEHPQPHLLAPPTTPPDDSSNIPAVLGAVAIGLGVLGFAAAWSGQFRLVGLVLGGLALRLGICPLLASV